MEIELAAKEGTAVMTVADRGPGLPEHEPWRVFDRFYRADSARSTPGSGLGLAIAASIVAAHGGGIQAENRPGGGAVFRVWFALMKAPLPGAVTPGAADPGSPAGS